MTSSWNRTGVKRRLGELAAYAFTGFDLGDDRDPLDLPIVYSWDPAQAYGPTVFLGLINGDAEPTSLGSRGIKTDRFTVRIDIALSGYTDPELAEKIAEDALRAFDTLLRSSSRLINTDVTSADASSYAGLSSAVITSVSGPFHMIDQPGSGTVTGVAGFDVSCTSDHIG